MKKYRVVLYISVQQITYSLGKPKKSIIICIFKDWNIFSLISKQNLILILFWYHFTILWDIWFNIYLLFYS